MKISVMEELMRGEIGRVLESVSPTTSALHCAASETYKNFFDGLSVRQKELYEQVEEADYMETSTEALRRFRLGFRTGLLLGLEIAELEIENE